MKKATTVFVCILLAVVIMLASSLATFIFIKDSIYVYDYHSLEHLAPNEVNMKLPWNYYSKKVPIHGTTPTFEEIISTKANICAARVVYKETVRKKKPRATLIFDIKTLLYGNFEGETINLEMSRYSYYSEFELLLYRDGAEYKKGCEYLLLFEVDADGTARPLGSEQSDGINNKHHRNYIAQLSGDYPSIKMVPGPVEYDATYFGAETKYVSADEFIELFIKAAQESIVRK